MKIRCAARRIVGVLLTVSLITGCVRAADPIVLEAISRDARARQAAELFLNGYVDPDGRVVRRDQGGDTVSEGQAYALLIAAAVGDGVVFDRVWEWTREHLMQPNALPAWRIDAKGAIPDTQSASDADMLIAWALLRDTGPNRQNHHAAGLAIADAVLKHEVVITAAGAPVLVAGPWAVNKRAVNVSYWSSVVFDDLARLTGSPAWSAMADQVSPMLDELTQGGALLPPDWAHLGDSHLQPSSSPQGVASSPSTRPQYGLDAQRAVVWSAVDCRRRADNDAARWYRTLDNQLRSGATGLALNGDILNGTAHPVPLVASAAAAHAADDDGAADSFMASAEDVYRKSPTFFGAAWIALGRVLLDTNALHPCQE